MAVVSPGIPPSAPIVRRLMDRGIEIVSEVELAFRIARCDFLAVTGTNGKTTTTSLLAAILEEAGVPTRAAGNIGYPLIDAVGEVGSDGALAVEVSSFQLAATQTFRPRVAVLLNVAEDHTDWHGSFDDYAAAKARIVANQTPRDFFLPNHDDPVAMKIASTARSRVVPFSALSIPPDGIGVSGGTVYRGDDAIFEVDDLPLPGAAGIEDATAAAGAALCYGIDPRAIRRALRSFRPLAHRLEVVARAGGVTYIDDSKATNPHATLSAVRGLDSVVLIAGGRSKGIDLSPLARTVPPVVAVVAIGQARDEIREVFASRVPVDVCDTMHEAVGRAIARSAPGGSVLLSPGCASLDMYESYKARGEDFARSVRKHLEARGEGIDGDA
jgi:UDP-N-acetylmuramoylalanine--D-glutamate ligase